MIATLTNKVKELVADADTIGGKVKVLLDNDAILIDGTDDTMTVSNEDEEADCTIKISPSNFDALLKGSLGPMEAFMKGKMKVQGDMGLAMKLSSLFS